ncbi:MAG: hypothetical protein GX874_00865 [Smithella sp.]|jgi:hypothetical protein|nr:hypothetical protein [Smithella sp.]
MVCADGEARETLRRLRPPGVKACGVRALRKRKPLLSLSFQEGLFQVYDEKSTGMIGDFVRKLNAIDPTD